MLSTLASHSPDLQRLVNEGYEVEIRADQLLVHHVPYVTPAKAVAYGTLVSELTTEGTSTGHPSTHEVYFIGEPPCDQHGRELIKIINQRGSIPLGSGLTAAFSFSSKPSEGYPDYYAKMTSYVNMLGGDARAIDPTAEATHFVPLATSEHESVFRYLDSATSRARIGAVSERLKLPNVAIVGLGGTGSYILDLIAKTPIEHIHLFDGDTFSTHNAFRAPGAASIEELTTSPLKVNYFEGKYNPLRRKIHAHPDFIDASNVMQLVEMSFVFLAIDTGPAKKLIIETLEAHDVSFIDVGMGLYEAQGSLGGIVRTTASTPQLRHHIRANSRISFAQAEDDEYDRNIQIADMNALNAVMAVIKWKKLYGFYHDTANEHSISYTIGSNDLLNEDFPE
jgi:hypothetical protein